MGTHGMTLFLLALLSLQGTWAWITFRYDIRFENGPLYFCDCYTNITTYQGTTGIPFNDSVLSPPQAGNICINVSGTNLDDLTFDAFNPGAANPCASYDNPTEYVTEPFHCGQCFPIYAYTVSSTNYTICLRQTNCSEDSFKRAAPLPPAKSTKPTQPNPVQRKPAAGGGWTREHYSKTSSNEVYDRTTYGGASNGGASSNPTVDTALPGVFNADTADTDDNWRARIPDSWKKYFPAPAGQPVNFLAKSASTTPIVTSWSYVAMYLMALAVVVLLVIGGYVFKRLHKRSLYEPVQDIADNDNHRS